MRCHRVTPELRGTVHPRPYRRILCFSLLCACLIAGPVRSHASSTLLQQAQALRDARDWDAALKLYRQGQRQHPEEAAYTWGEIYVLADSDAAAQAVTMAQHLLLQQPRNVDALLVMAYAQLRQHGVFASLEYVDRAMAEAGERSYVVREYVLALQRAHQPEAALRIAQQYPGLLSPMQHWELQADALAFSVRFADLSTRSEEERFAIADRTLQQYRQLLTQLQYAGAGAEPPYQRVRLNRLQAFPSSLRAGPSWFQTHAWQYGHHRPLPRECLLRAYPPRYPADTPSASPWKRKTISAHTTAQKAMRISQNSLFGITA